MNADTPSTSRPARRRAGAWEVFWLVLLAVYTVVFWSNYAGRYHPTEDPDPDGYVTHARELRETGGLVSHHRLPGYPLFILLADMAFPGDIAANVFWVQGALGWLFSGALLALFWRMGPRSWLMAVGAAFFVLLHGLGSFWGLFTATMMSNFLGSLLAAVVAGGLWWLWAKARTPLTRALGLGVLLLLIFASVVVHPVNYMVLGLLVPAIVGAWLLTALVAKLRGADWPALRERFLPPALLIWRLGLMLAVFFGTAFSRGLSYTFFDRPDESHRISSSSRKFSEEWLAHQMLLRLPPADMTNITPADREVEAIKDRLSARLGWRVERLAMPPFYPEYMTWRGKEGGRGLDVNHMWKERLLANPGAALFATWEELLHKYHVLLRQSLPAPSYWDVYPFNNENAYPADDGSSLKRRLFWTYGMDLTHFRKITDTTAEKKVWRRVNLELRYLAAAVLLPLLGLVLAMRFSALPGVFLTGFLWMLGYLAALAFCGFINGRYFLPFFPFLYVLQSLAAGGLALAPFAMGRWAWRKWRSRPSPLPGSA